MIVAVLFTKSNGQPATGLTLSEISITLKSRARSDGTLATIWNGVAAAEEIGGGLYAKEYASADSTTYTYYAWAQYMGVTALDSNYALMTYPFTQVSSAGSGAIAYVYTVTSDTTPFSPIADVDVWVTTDLAGSNVVASGKTDNSGQVTFYLDAGTYYFWRQKAGWNATNPDTEVVS